MHVPFSGSCNATTAKWQQFVGNCKYFISLEALAWTLCESRSQAVGRDINLVWSADGLLFLDPQLA